MAKQENPAHKKSRGRGRPPGRAYGETLPLRITPEMKAQVEDWKQQEGVASLNEALRRLIENALATSTKRGR